MSAPPDEYYIKRYDIPPEAILSGSDLRAVTPREMLGIFVGLRARYLRDIGECRRAENDYLLARWLFQSSQSLFREAWSVVKWLG